MFGKHKPITVKVEIILHSAGKSRIVPVIFDWGKDEVVVEDGQTIEVNLDVTLFAEPIPGARPIRRVKP
jgi:hypothetical protein